MSRRLLKALAFAVVGLAVGLAYGGLRLAVAGEHDPALPSMADPDRLVDMLRANPSEAPAVRNVVIHPLSSPEDRAQLVTCELRRIEYAADGSRINRWEPVKAWVSVPIAAEGNAATLEAHVENLRAAGTLIPGVRLAWWRRPYLFMLACGAAGALMLAGGAVATDLLRGAPPEAAFMLPAPQESESEAARTRGLTDDEQSQLTAAIDDLAPTIPLPAPGNPQAPSPPAKRFVAGPAVPEPALVKSPRGRHYEGEYYPVERTGGHDQS